MVSENETSKNAPVPSHNLLRSARKKLRNEYDRLYDEKFVASFVVVFAFWMVCLIAWIQKFAGQVPDPSFWTLLSLFVTVYGGFQVFRLRPQLRRLRFGELGERQVTEALERIRDKGYLVFHDLPLNGTTVDHVVVGATGVYALEMKTRNGADLIRYQNDNELLIGSKINDSPALRHARGAAYAIQEQLRESLHTAYWVKPVLVFVGSRRVQQPVEDHTVDVITANDLENYFARQQPEISETEVAHIRSHFEGIA